MTFIDYLSGVLSRGVSLIYGEPGSGKTSIAMWYAHRRLLEGHRVLWISAYETARKLHEIFSYRGIDVSSRRELLAVVDVPSMSPKNIEDLINHVIEMVEGMKPSVTIIDGVNAVASLERHYYHLLYHLYDGPLIMIGESNLKESPAAYIADNIIEVTQNIDRHGSRYRAIKIIKSRFTSPPRTLIEFVMTRRGPLFLESYVCPGGDMTTDARFRVAKSEQDADLPIVRGGLRLHPGTFNVIVNDGGQRGVEVAVLLAYTLAETGKRVVMDVHTHAEGYWGVLGKYRLRELATLELVKHQVDDHKEEHFEEELAERANNIDAYFLLDGDMTLAHIGERRIMHNIGVLRSANCGATTILLVEPLYWKMYGKRLYPYVDLLVEVTPEELRILRKGGISLPRAYTYYISPDGFIIME